MLSSKADDIRDLQIEGMSIGDSALDFFSETLIKNGTKSNPMNSAKQKYEVTTIYTKKTGNYINVADFDFAVFEAVEIIYKKNDSNFKIEAVSGSITNEKKDTEPGGDYLNILLKYITGSSKLPSGGYASYSRPIRFTV